MKRFEYNEYMRDDTVSDGIFNKSSMRKIIAFIPFKSNIPDFENVVCL